VTGIEFGELPRHYGGARGGVWVPVFEALRAKPGEWAKIRTGKNYSSVRNMAQYIRTGNYVGSVAGEFEATTRGCDLWARYVGGDS
jgi:hypothetical protein